MAALRNIVLGAVLALLPVTVSLTPPGASAQSGAYNTGLPTGLTSQLDTAARTSPQALSQRLAALQDAFPHMAVPLAEYAHMLQPTPDELVPPAPPSLGIAPSTIPAAPADAIRPAILGQSPQYRR